MPPRIPRQIGAALYLTNSVAVVGTVWWVGNKLGELHSVKAHLGHCCVTDLSRHETVTLR